jgi:hypothetical protein
MLRVMFICLPLVIDIRVFYFYDALRIQEGYYKTGASDSMPSLQQLRQQTYATSKQPCIASGDPLPAY